MDYKPGDIIVCKISNNEIVEHYKQTFDSKQKFEIIGIDDGKYVLYVPIDLIIKGSFELLSEKYCQNYNVPKKFIGSKIIKVSDVFIDYLYRKSDGIICKKCNEFYPMAQSNQEDGTLICWLCSKYPYRNHNKKYRY